MSSCSGKIFQSHNHDSNNNCILVYRIEYLRNTCFVFLFDVQEPPFIIYDPNITMREAHNGPYTGFVVDMMEWLSGDLQFNYTMSEPPDLKYGSVNESGIGNGMVGQLMNCVSFADLIGEHVNV